MSKYAVVNASPRLFSSTAAVAQLLTIYNAAAAPVGQFRLYEWSIGPGVTSADTIYTFGMARTLIGGGAWTAAPTPSPLDGKVGAALTLAGDLSTAAATVGVYLGRWGFHFRGGYRWVAIPGGEFQVLSAVSAGLALVCTYAQSTETGVATMYFDE
jgi:hypothetical protein